MSPISAARSRNQLLAALSPRDFKLLEPHLTPVKLKLRRDLEKPNEQITDVYFIDAGIASVVAIQRKREMVEVGLIGCEGMSGTAVVLDSGSSPNSIYLQIAGEGRHISAGALRNAMEASKTLHGTLLKYVQAFMVQTNHTAVANARAKVHERLARWILMADDRVPGHRLPLTHEFLGLMLGVRRAGVTEALQTLSTERLIEAGRGMIVVLNRKGIERVAGDLYGVPEAEYRRLI